jgi:uncharacterized protein YhaN
MNQMKDNNNNLVLSYSRKHKKLVKQQAELEASLNKVSAKIQKEAEGKARQRKLDNLYDKKAWYELWLQDKWKQIQQEERNEHLNYLKRHDKQAYKQEVQLQKAIAQHQQTADSNLRRHQNRGNGSIAAGQVLMALGTIISILGFFGGGGWATFGVGLVLNLIGIGLYKSGKGQRGEDSTVFFAAGGAVSG